MSVNKEFFCEEEEGFKESEKVQSVNENMLRLLTMSKRKIETSQRKIYTFVRTEKIKQFRSAV